MASEIRANQIQSRTGLSTVTFGDTGVVVSNKISSGDTFIKDKYVGLGTITTAERNAGVGTAVGTLIYNANTNSVEGYGPAGWVAIKQLVSTEGINATGGVISDYTDPSTGNIYRAHVFTSTGNFEVTKLSTDYPNNVEYLVVGGGGGGGAINSGGGGAGGLLSNHPGIPAPLRQPSFAVTAGPTSYTVTVGAGGRGNDAPGAALHSPGSPSVFGPGPITAYGGGRGSSDSNPHSAGTFGSGGGGGGNPSGASGSATGQTGTSGQGNSGGNLSSPTGDSVFAGGGGGAGGAGNAGSPTQPGSGDGGNGLPVAIESATAKNYAGGGGGSWIQGPAPRSGPGYVPQGKAGGGNGGIGESGAGSAADINTGSGGGGSRAAASGAGGSGIVVVRYQIGSSQTGTAKATGGAIGFYNGQTIHTFTSSSTFVTPSTFNETVTYVLVGGGGGGGGGYYHGGGGGAGGYRTGTTPISGSNTFTVTVGSGGYGSYSTGSPSSDPGGDGSYSQFGPLYVGAGGGGATYQVGTIRNGVASPQGSDGGSGGGGRGSNQPPNAGGTGGPYGYPGGTGYPASESHGSGGGGGAGGAGADATSTAGGAGGNGVRLPSVFHNPDSAPGPGTGPTVGGGLGSPGPAGGFYVAGGGGGSVYTGVSPYPAGVGGYGGGGDGSDGAAENALRNTGGGGGGSERSGAANQGGNGGSGIVLIAYPS